MGRFGGKARWGGGGGFGRSSRSNDPDGLRHNAAGASGASMDKDVLSSLGEGFMSCDELSLLFKQCASYFGTDDDMCQVYSEKLSKRNCRGSPPYDSYFDYFMKTSRGACKKATTHFEECASDYGSGDDDACSFYRSLLSQYCGRKMDAKPGA